MIDRSKNLCAYNRYDTQDGHGGKRDLHLEEMREQAEIMIHQLVPKMIEAEIEQKVIKTWNEAIPRLIGALRYDIEACVEIAFNNGEDIFRSSKVQKYISDQIMNSLIMELSKIKGITIK